MPEGELPLVRTDLQRANLPPVPPRRWHEGERVGATKLNETVDAVRRSYGAIRPPREVRAVEATAPLEVQQFKVRAELVGTDCVICERHQGHPFTEGEGDVVLVALPPLLRRSTFDTGSSAPAVTGQSRDSISYAYTSNTERTATDADDHTEDQVIVPSYVEGDIITAVRQEGVGAGVWVESATGDKTELEWRDLNLDARAWGAA